MKMHIAKPEQGDDRHHESRQLRITVNGEEFRSYWYITERILTDTQKKSPGVPMFDSTSELRGYHALTAHGEYIFRKYRKPKPSINYGGDKLKFHEEVKTADTAQAIIDGFKVMGMPAACTHKYGLHQVYVKHKTIRS